MVPGSGVRGRLGWAFRVCYSGARIRPLLGLTPPRLVSAQFPIDHFTHIFIDEAGHSMEPESLVAIAGEGVRAGHVRAAPHGGWGGPTAHLSPHGTLPLRADGSQGNRQSRRAAGAGRRP